MVTQIWVNTGSGNGFLSDSTKAKSESMLTYNQKVVSGIRLRAISQVLISLIWNMYSDLHFSVYYHITQAPMR